MAARKPRACWVAIIPPGSENFLGSQSKVEPAGPAGKAHLEPGDVVKSYQGQDVQTADQSQPFPDGARGHHKIGFHVA